MTQTELKSCPFCGQEPMLCRMRLSISSRKLWQIWCDNIECATAPFIHEYENKEYIIEAWNRRVST